MRPIALLLTTSLLGFCLGSQAQTPSPIPLDALRDAELRQRQLDTEVRRISDQLDALLGEFERNALNGAEADSVKAARDTLRKMSTEDIQQVLDSLQKARSTTDGTAPKSVATAFTGQKQVLVEIQKMLAIHERNQQAAELSRKLEKMADRQAANLQLGIELGRMMGAGKAGDFAENLQASMQGQSAEQAAIHEELQTIAQQLAQFASTGQNAEENQRLLAGAEDARKVAPATEEAADALKNGQLFKAVTAEKQARDSLRKLARQVAPPKALSEMLRKAEKDLAAMAAEQKQLLEKVEAAKGTASFDAWLVAQIEAQKAAAAEGKPTDPRFARKPTEMRADASLQQAFLEARDKATGTMAALEDQQGDLAMRGDLLAQDLQAGAPEIAKVLAESQAAMMGAREAMADANGQAAAQNARQALEKLAQAQAQVTQQTAVAEVVEGKQTGNASLDAARLQQAARALAEQFAAAATNPQAQAQQQALAERAAGLAQQGGKVAPQAAGALQQAAQAAQQAAGAAAQAAQAAAAGARGAPQAAAAQQQAAQANQQAAAQLQAAAKQLQQQAAVAQAAQQQLQQAQKAIDELTEIVKAELDLERQSARNVAQAEPDLELFLRQAMTQNNILERTDRFSKNLTLEVPMNAFATATASMSTAKTDLEKGEGKSALAYEQKALQSLYAAQRSLEELAAEAAKLAGEENENRMAQASEQLQAANAALAEAGEELAEGDPADAAAALEAAAAAAGAAAAQSALSPAAQQAAAQAAQAASNAAAQAAAGNIPGAQASAQAASQALAQAQASMSAAQSGIAASAASAPTPASAQGASKADAQQGDAGAEGETATRVNKAISFTGLPPRERKVVEQSRGERYPEEYSVFVEQYLRNLAEDSAKK